MMRYLPAAAVPAGAVVKLPDDIPSARETITVTHITNSVPRPGLLAWEDEDGLEVEVSGAQRIEVLTLP